MALSKAKSGCARQSHFGSVEPCKLLETRSSSHDASDQSWVLFEQPAFNATREDHFLESKKLRLRPENEIAAVTFLPKLAPQCFCKSNRVAGSRGPPLLIQGLQPHLHVANLCQSTMLFGIVWLLLSQAFAAWPG